MPRYVNDFADERWKQWCIHCGDRLDAVVVNKDHIPSKSLLRKPYPDNLAVTHICEECNTSFSCDEEYVVAFLSAVFSGTTDPEKQISARGEEIFTRNIGLSKRINSSRSEDDPNVWFPEMERFENVIVKNSRGHVLYDGGEARTEPPVRILIKPIKIMAQDELDDFFDVGGLSSWPEVGSRWMQRVVEGDSFDRHGFLIVQPGTYRYKLQTNQGIGVKSIIHDYLATDVLWE